MRAFTVLFLFFSLRAALVCHQGTVQALGNCTASGQDTCISGTLAPGNNTAVYACGNCTLFQSLLVNVTCCSAADLCQSVAPPSPPGACDTLVSEANCTARADCYWCGAGLLGFSLCQSFVGLPLPAFALNLVVPPPVCSSVVFQPFQPAYTVDQLTLAYLEAYGFPPVASNLAQAAGLSLDVLSRYANTRVMNDTEQFCVIDDDLRNWCGVNITAGFQYCVVSETWPQYDICMSHFFFHRHTLKRL